MRELYYAKDGDFVLVYHHCVMGLALLKKCPLLKEEHYSGSIMTGEWFNSIVDWLCDNYLEEFNLVLPRPGK